MPLCFWATPVWQCVRAAASPGHVLLTPCVRVPFADGLVQDASLSVTACGSDAHLMFFPGCPSRRLRPHYSEDTLPHLSGAAFLGNYSSSIFFLNENNRLKLHLTTHTHISFLWIPGGFSEWICVPSICHIERPLRDVSATYCTSYCVCACVCACVCVWVHVCECVCVQVSGGVQICTRTSKRLLAALSRRPSCLLRVSLFTSTFLLTAEALTPPSSNCSDACRKLHRMNVAPHFMLSRQLKKQARHLSQTWATPQAQSWPSGDGGPSWPCILPLTVPLMD